MNQIQTETFRFPGGINMIHQTGAVLTDTHPGVNVLIHFGTLSNGKREAFPRCAEVFSDDIEMHAEIGLCFDGSDGGEIALHALSDYDGAFELPREVAVALEFLGFTVPPDFKAEKPADLLALADLFPMLRKMFAWAKEAGGDELPRGVTMEPTQKRVYICDGNAFCDEAARHGRGAFHAALFLSSLYDPQVKFAPHHAMSAWDSEHRRAWVESCARYAAKA